ncbi:MAG TPA: hypothetical protein VFG83_09335 [Kofleriaceae bacterium]|nr:hypothetical protein [Kofleriaceae bacterium]
MTVRTARLARLGRDHGELLWAPFLYAAVVAVLYRQVWSGDVGFGWDTIETYWADLAYLSDQLFHGEWPLWNPYGRGGYPFHADPQAGLYYPVNWLFAVAGGVMGGVGWWTIQIKMLAHHVLAGLMMHAYIRSRGLPRTAAVVASVAWVCSAPMMVHKASGVLWPMVWIPLIWLCCDRMVARPSWRRGCALAFALYLAGSAGSPPGLFYTLIAAALYGGYRVIARLLHVARGPSDRRWPEARKLALALAVATVVTLALMAIIVVPGLILKDHSVRSHLGPRWALSVPLAVKGGLIGLVQPFAGDSQVYCGITVAMLVLCAVVMRPLRDGGAAIFFFLAAAFFLLLAFGDSTPLLPWLVEHGPGFRLFRIANRYKLPFAAIYSAAAGFGAAALIDQGHRLGKKRLAAVAVAMVILGLVAIIVWRADIAGPKTLPGAQSIIVAVIAAALVIGAVLRRPRASAILVAAMALVIAWEVPHFRSPRGPIMERHPPDDEAEILAGLDGISDRWRVYDEFVLEQRAGPRLGIRELRGYPSGDPLDLATYKHVRDTVRKHPDLLAELNVRYLLHGRHHRNGVRKNTIKGMPPAAAFRRIDGRRYEVRDPAPLIAWYGGAVIEKRWQDQLATMASFPGADHIRRKAVIDPATAATLGSERLAILGRSSPPPSVAGTLASYGADGVALDIDAPGPGLVVLNEVMYPGWRVTVDGDQRPPLSANYLLRAVWVGPGHHHITWTFAPQHYRWWLALWLAALVLCAAALLPLRRRAKSAAVAPADSDEIAEHAQRVDAG